MSADHQCKITRNTNSRCKSVVRVDWGTNTLPFPTPLVFNMVEHKCPKETISLSHVIVARVRHTNGDSIVESKQEHSAVKLRVVFFRFVNDTRHAPQDFSVVDESWVGHLDCRAIIIKHLAVYEVVTFFFNFHGSRWLMVHDTAKPMAQFPLGNDVIFLKRKKRTECYYETRKTLNTTNTHGMLLFSEEKP